jgi:hypothetical protein
VRHCQLRLPLLLWLAVVCGDAARAAARRAKQRVAVAARGGVCGAAWRERCWQHAHCMVVPHQQQQQGGRCRHGNLRAAVGGSCTCGD